MAHLAPVAPLDGGLGLAHSFALGRRREEVRQVGLPRGVGRQALAQLLPLRLTLCLLATTLAAALAPTLATAAAAAAPATAAAAADRPVPQLVMRLEAVGQLLQGGVDPDRVLLVHRSQLPFPDDAVLMDRGGDRVDRLAGLHG